MKYLIQYGDKYLFLAKTTVYSFRLPTYSEDVLPKWLPQDSIKSVVSIGLNKHVALSKKVTPTFSAGAVWLTVKELEEFDSIGLVQDTDVSLFNKLIEKVAYGI